MTMNADQNPDRLDDLRAEYANTGMVKYEGAVWLISQVVVLRERVQQSAAVSVPPPADQTALRDRIAEALMRWAEGNNDQRYAAVRRPETVRANAYSRADAVLAVLPAAADGAAALREAADWFEREHYVTHMFGHQAAALLRQKATEAQPTETPSMRLARASIESMIATVTAERPAVGEQPETQETPTECAHCWREIENRGTPSMGGNHHVKWVHVPGGFTVCFPQRGGSSPLAEPRATE